MLKRLPPPLRQGLFALITVLTGMGAVMAPWVRGPGLELAGITPDWPLIWVVCWSVRRAAWQGAVAGVALGLLQDGLTQAQPTHALGLGLAGFLTARLQKQRFVQEDFISVALIVFGMTVISQTVMALQWTMLTSLSLRSAGFALSWMGNEAHRSVESIWITHQKITLTSAILSSLWAPVLYLPLNWCWQQDRS